MVAFHARLGAVAALVPPAEDADRLVRMVVGRHLGGLGDPAAEPTSRMLLTDPDETVRKFAARGLERE